MNDSGGAIDTNGVDPADYTEAQRPDLANTVPGVDTEEKKGQRNRINRPYPNLPFEDALELAIAIQQHAAGKPVRRLTLFDTLKKSPDSSASRNLITSASKYGLIKGTYKSETLELTEDGKVVSSDEYSEYERVQTLAETAILRVPPFRAIYDELAGNKFPARQFLVDLAKRHIIPESLVPEALDIFIANAKFTGLLRVMSGVERLVKVELLLDLVERDTVQKKYQPTPDTYDEEIEPDINPPKAIEFSKTLPIIPSVRKTDEDVCFYVSPIGELGSEQRQHADLFLSYIIEPAVNDTGLGLKVVRADKIDRSGVITSQIIRFLLKSRLVIVDLSFHNPNVFYELAIRHATRLPTVHIMRSADPIPFDLNQMRIIKIDSTSIYTLVPQLDTYRSEISLQVRKSLEDDAEVDNPLSIYYPTFRVTID